MATPFFGKREDTLMPPSRLGSANNYLSPLSSASQPGGLKSSLSESNSLTATGGSKLTVGPNIKLKGVEITDCDTLVIDGLVEATMSARVMLLSEQGAYKGAAELELAEIRGEFTGELTVRQKLVIYATGRVSGTVRYGKLVVEDGAQLSGDVALGAAAAVSPAPAADKPAAVAKTPAAATAA